MISEWPGDFVGIRTPNPVKVRALNIVGHTVFAIGLFGTALLIR